MKTERDNSSQVAFEQKFFYISNYVEISIEDSSITTKVLF